jgi:hypothetical protein
MSANLPGMVASGDINRCRFVKVSGDFQLAQAGAGELVFGVAQEGTKEAPIPGASSLHAVAGDVVRYYADGDVCEIEVGAAVAAGALVKADANGRAITCTAADKYAAQCIRAQATATNRGLFIIRRGVA